MEIDTGRLVSRVDELAPLHDAAAKLEADTIKQNEVNIGYFERLGKLAGEAFLLEQPELMSRHDRDVGVALRPRRACCARAEEVCESDARAPEDAIDVVHGAESTVVSGTPKPRRWRAELR